MPRQPQSRGIYQYVLFTVLFAAALTAAAGAGDEFWPGVEYDPSIPAIEEVLGFGPGERIFSHAELMSYMDALAEAQPHRIRVFEYARSWEGRKLVYAVIGSEENVGRLDEIKRGDAKAGRS